MEQPVTLMLAAAAVGGFAVTAVTCWLLIPALHRLHFGQTIREEGPTWHNKKNGTPTMGGLGFIFGILVTLGLVWALFHGQMPEVLGPQQLAAGMMAGTGKLMLHQGKHPGQMKDDVCSPGGTTIRGVAALERAGLRTAVIQAVEAAMKTYE